MTENVRFAFIKKTATILGSERTFKKHTGKTPMQYKASVRPS